MNRDLNHTNKSRINRTNSNINRNQYSNNRRRKRNLKRRKRKITIIFLLILSILLYIIYKFVSKKNDIHDTSYIDRYYTQTNYSKMFNQFNNNLYYKKYNNVDGTYNLLNSEQWDIKNKYIDNYEYYLWDKLKYYLDENNISQDDLSLSIKQDEEFVLNLNHLEEFDIDIYYFAYLLFIRDNIDNGKIILDDSISIIESDLVNGSNIFSKDSIGIKFRIESIIRNTINLKDQASKIILDRYLSSKGLSLDGYLESVIGKIYTGKYTTTDMVKLIEVYEKSNSIINSLFSNILNNSDELFTNSIYSNIGNENISVDNSYEKYEIGVINSDFKYYYAIYTSKLTQKQIQEIGDIVNRTISEINLIRSIQK